MNHPVEAYDWGDRISDHRYGFRQLLRLPNGWTICRRNIGESGQVRYWMVGLCDQTLQFLDPYTLLSGQRYKPVSFDDKRELSEDELLLLVRAVEAYS